MKPKLWVGFDPGDTTGVAVWSERNGKPSLVERFQLPFDDLYDYLERVDTNLKTYLDVECVFIIEDFRLFAKRAVKQAGSSMKASQVIGALKLFAKQHGIAVVMQPASIKDIALKWSQIKLPSTHSKTHEWDAYLHSYYYLVKHNLLETVLQTEVKNGRPQG